MTRSESEAARSEASTATGSRLRPTAEPSRQRGLRPARSAAGGPAATHALTYQGRTVTVTDTVVPAPLRPVLTELNQIVIEVRAG
jgi:hypothetical protein